MTTRLLMKMTRLTTMTIRRMTTIMMTLSIATRFVRTIALLAMKIGGALIIAFIVVFVRATSCKRQVHEDNSLDLGQERKDYYLSRSLLVRGSLVR